MPKTKTASKKIKINLSISDERMLGLRAILKADGKIRFNQEFCDALGFHKQNIRNVKIGLQHFTAEHISMAGKVYGINTNYIHGLEDNVYRLIKKSAVIKMASLKYKTVRK